MASPLPFVASPAPRGAREEGRNMDPETVEALLILGRLAFIIGGGCAVVMGSLWGMTAAAIYYFHRQDHIDELMPQHSEA